MSSRFCLFVWLLSGSLGAACVYTPPEPFTEAQVLGGEQVSAVTLNAGQEAYGFYCLACHGRNGDGRGPSSVGLVTPPRDFRVAMFKFAGVSNGLPHDEDLARIVRGGLHGTAMLPWEMPEETLKAVIQYIKSFSPAGEGWRDPDNEKEEPIKPGQDPWEGQGAAAIKRGEAVYHGIATCFLCHPSYVSGDKINEYAKTFGLPAKPTFRPGIWNPEAKASDTYTRPVQGDPTCDDDTECKNSELECRYGRCESKVNILPPDFLVNEIRSGQTTADIFRTIASGIPGTAMPRWKGVVADKDLWAMANYIKSLMSQKGTDGAFALRNSIKTDSIQAHKKAEEAAKAAAAEAEGAKTP